MCTAPSVTGAAPFESVASPCAKAVSASHVAEPSCVSHMGRCTAARQTSCTISTGLGDHEAVVHAF